MQRAWEECFPSQYVLPRRYRAGACDHELNQSPERFRFPVNVKGAFVPVGNRGVMSDDRKLTPYAEVKEVGERYLNNATMADNHDCFSFILPGNAINAMAGAHDELHQTISVGGQLAKWFLIPIRPAKTLNNLREGQALALAQIKLLDLVIDQHWQVQRRSDDISCFSGTFQRAGDQDIGLYLAGGG